MWRSYNAVSVCVIEEAHVADLQQPEFKQLLRQVLFVNLYVFRI